MEHISQIQAVPARVLAVFAAVLLAASSSAISGTGGDPGERSGHEQGGHVLPARAEPHDASLSEIAKATAVFNTSDHSGTPPATPFQVLYTTSTNTFDVQHGTTLYVPVLYIDDSPTVLGNFPSLANREAVLHYVYSQSQIGVQYATITVDGKETSLDDSYVAAVTTAPLSDGGGTHYIVIGAYVSPLSTGHHIVNISAEASGTAVAPPPFIFSIDYSVNVQ